MPSYAAGLLYRTGPYAFRVEDTPSGTYSLSHWFGGFSQTHRFQIIPTSTWPVQILYSSRSQVVGLVVKIRKAGDFYTYIFAQEFDPCKGFLDKLFSAFAPTEPYRPDTTNVSVCIRSISRKCSGKNRTTLIIESDFSMVKDLETLEPIGIAHQSILYLLLKGLMSCAHSTTDLQTGDAFNYKLEFSRYTTYRAFRVNATSGTTDILATVTVQIRFLHISPHSSLLRILWYYAYGRPISRHAAWESCGRRTF